MTMGDRVAVLDRGELQQVGTPRALYDEPANLFVAGFIGSPAMNLVGGRLLNGAHGPEIALGDRRLALPASLVARKPALARHIDRNVVIGIRSEALKPASTGRNDAAMVGVVAFVEDLGATLLVHLDVDAPAQRLGAQGGMMLEDADVAVGSAGARIRVSIEGHAAVKPGDRLAVAIDPDRLHFFDPETGSSFGA
jgi:multiple sugar transport system ATP-binding protein